MEVVKITNTICVVSYMCDAIKKTQNGKSNKI